MTESKPVAITDVNPLWQPQIDRQFRLQWEAAQNSYVLLYPEGMVKLNFSGGQILSLCDGVNSVADVVAELTERFPDAPELEQDVLEFLATAVVNQWLQYD